MGIYTHKQPGGAEMYGIGLDSHAPIYPTWPWLNGFRTT